LENDFLELETRFSSKSVRLPGKPFAEAGNEPGWISNAGNTFHPIMLVIGWKRVFQSWQSTGLTFQSWKPTLPAICR
jgi:hypothetical protein